MEKNLQCLLLIAIDYKRPILKQVRDKQPVNQYVDRTGWIRTVTTVKILLSTVHNPWIFWLLRYTIFVIIHMKQFSNLCSFKKSIWLWGCNRYIRYVRSFQNKYPGVHEFTPVYTNQIAVFVTWSTKRVLTTRWCQNLSLDQPCVGFIHAWSVQIDKHFYLSNMN